MVVLVTGGSGGIGGAVCKKLLADGHSVIINYNTSEEPAKMLENEYTGAFCIKADVSDEKQVADMFAKIEEKFGGIDALVNNAGISLTGCFQTFSFSDYEKIMNTNFGSAFLCSKYAVSHMIKKGKGNIINISSMWGKSGASCEALYSASKAALIAFSQALSKELAPSGIRVNCIAPGVIETAMNKHLGEKDMSELAASTPLGRIGKPEDIANAVKFLLGDDSAFIIGQTLLVDGGYLNS